MIPISQPQMKRLTAVHGWSGVILGLLLFTVVITGTVAVFGDDIARWSTGSSTQRGIDKPIDGIVRNLAERLPLFYLDDIAVWKTDAGELMAFFHSHAENPATGRPDEYGAMFRIDPESGEVLDRNEGFMWKEPWAWDPSALRHFLVDLHVQLYLPDPWGLIVTGILGLLMMAAAVSGFLMHRHMIRDLFVAERPGARLVSARDRHVLASSWSLPFAVILAFTGSFFSFASTVSFPIVAQVAFGGDNEAMARTLFEPPVVEDTRRVRPADLDAIRAKALDKVGGPLTFISIHHYGRADARIHVWHSAADGRLGFTQTVFDGAAGTFLEVKPQVGNKPSMGNTIRTLMWPLHVGDFAGLVSKAVWGALGATTCFVILSGLRRWVRRREEEPLWRGFGRALTVTALGLPIAMLASAWAFFLALPAADPFFWTPFGFVAGALACAGLGLAVRDDGKLRALFWRILAWACLLLPLLRLAAGGTSWAEALARNHGEVLSIDLLLLAAGGLMWWARDRRRAPTVVPQRPTMEPAE